MSKQAKALRKLLEEQHALEKRINLRVRGLFPEGASVMYLHGDISVRSGTVMRHGYGTMVQICTPRMATPWIDASRFL